MDNWESYKERLTKKNSALGKYSKNQIEEFLSYGEKLYKSNMPIIFTPLHLSKMLGVDKSELYKISNSDSHFYYKTFTIPKRTKGRRIINSPLPTLKLIQTWIYKNILLNTEQSKYCKSYVPGVTLRENAKFHRGQNVVLKMDITDFFNNIPFESVYSLFKSMGYYNNVALLLTNMVMMKEDNQYSGISQGAPTSPAISNIVLREFDETLGKYCLDNNVRYTRYADDLTFSGSFDTQRHQSIVTALLYKHGYKVNNRKTQVINQNSRQIVTGIVVNNKLQIEKVKRKAIRLEVHYLNKNIFKHLYLRAGTNYQAQEKYLKSLLGRINFALQVNPKDKKMIGYKKNVHEAIKLIVNKSENEVYFDEFK